jgi:hypothetical protein
MWMFALGIVALLSPPIAPSEGGENSSETSSETSSEASALEAPAEKPAEKSPKKASEKSKAEEPVKKRYVEVEARIVGGVRFSTRAAPVDSEGAQIGLPEGAGGFKLRQARVGIDAGYRDILRARVSVDFADLLESPKPGKVLRNAWVNVAIHPAFQIKVGQFKRPYSRLELRGFSSIPFLGRGLYNDLAVEDLRWGDRAVGVSLWGKIEATRPGLSRLRWQVSASNDVVAGAPHGVDVHARLTYDPTAWLSFGINGAIKHVQDPLADEAACRATLKRGASCRRNVFAGGGDLAIDVKGFYMSVETNLAQDWLYAETSPWMIGALGYASYEFQVGPHTRLQPAVFGEYVDANLSYAQSEAVRTGAAFNVLWTNRLRIIPQVEFVVPLAPVTAFNRFVTRQVYGLWIAVEL